MTALKNSVFRPLAEHRTKAPTFAAFVDCYAQHIQALFARVDKTHLNALHAALENAKERGATLFVVANGGSAGSANHLANGIGFHLINRAGSGFRTLSLCENNVALTAIPNDTAFDQVFVGQLKQLYRPGDVLIALSCSGISSNVVNAARYVQQRGGTVLGFTGWQEHSPLAEYCDLEIRVPAFPEEYGPIEDIHMMVFHALVHWYEYA